METLLDNFVISTIIAIVVLENSFLMLMLSLVLLGLGLNIGFISGTTLLVKHTKELNRVKYKEILI